jgi:SAM-dependent methyltransferase
MSTQAITEARYDTYLYPRMAFRPPHPEVMAARAKLFGLTEPPTEEFRFLEIGCATGSHLIGLACAYPRAAFVGLDLSANQLKIAQDDVAALGLTNIEFRHASVTEVDESWGEFDYIATHGVYSWVPAPVQESILSVCHDRLKPHGIAYVSYNCYPGWHVKGITRDLMLYQSRFAANDEDRLAQGKAILAYLAANAPVDTPFTKLLQNEAAFIAKADDHYLLHEHLEEHNVPLYFYQFADRISAAGLEYLADTELVCMFPLGLNEAAQKQISATPDQVRLEQYLDFVRNTAFRRSLVVRADQRVSHADARNRLPDFRFAAALQPMGRYFKTEELVAFKSVAGGQELTVGGFAAKNGAEVLAEAWPSSLTLTEWVDRVQQVGAKVGAPHIDSDPLRNILLQVAWVGVVNGLMEPRVSREVYAGPRNMPERPLASPFVRSFSKRGHSLVTLRNDMVDGDAGFAFLLPLLDGTRTKKDLEAATLAALAEGAITLEPNPSQTKSIEEVAKDLVDGFWREMSKRAFVYREGAASA